MKNTNNNFKYLIYLLLFVFAVESLIYIGKIFTKTQREQTSPKTSIQTFNNPKHTENLKIPVLVYHYIEHVTDARDTIRKSLNINPETFELQIKTLIADGYQFIAPKDISKIENGDLQIHGKPIIISFDDGYRDFYTDVFPILKKYQITAVAYIAPGFLDKPNYMFTWQLKEVANSKLVEIGDHTMDHLSLAGRQNAIVQKEVQGAKDFLEKDLNVNIVSFAYPYGRFDNQTEEIVKKTGLTNAVTTISGIYQTTDDKFLIKRIHPGARIGNALISYLQNPSNQINPPAINNISQPQKLPIDNLPLEMKN